MAQALVTMKLVFNTKCFVSILGHLPSVCAPRIVFMEAVPIKESSENWIFGVKSTLRENIIALVLVLLLRILF